MEEPDAYESFSKLILSEQIVFLEMSLKQNLTRELSIFVYIAPSYSDDSLELFFLFSLKHGSELVSWRWVKILTDMALTLND